MFYVYKRVGNSPSGYNGGKWEFLCTFQANSWEKACEMALEHFNPSIADTRDGKFLVTHIADLDKR